MNTMNGLPKVGVAEQSLPEPLTTSSQQEDEGSSWWQTQKSIPGPNQDPAPKKWRSTTSEEIEKFRPVPVVGRLPWRIQYIMVSGVFLLALLALLFSASFVLKSSGASAQDFSSLQQSLALMESNIEVSLSGKEVDNERLQQKIAQAQNQLSSWPVAVQGSWEKIVQLSQNVPAWEQDARAIASASQQTYEITNQTIAELTPFWRQAGEEGLWNSPDAVNFAQMLAEWQYLQEASKNWSQGQGDISARLATARQNIDQAIRVFASSPQAQQQNSLTQAFRVAASGFLKLRPHLDVIAGRATSWNNLLGARQIIKNEKKTIWEAISATTPPSSIDKSFHRKGIGVSGTIVLLSLLLLMWIGFKQHKWHLLQARNSFEQLQSGVEDISQQLRRVASGDLTSKIKPSDPLVQPIADIFNSTLKKWRQLVTNVKHTSDAASRSADNASETTGSLVSMSREHVELFSLNVEDIMSLSSAMQDIADWSNEASIMSQETLQSAEVGQEADEDVANHIRGIREKSEEGLSRTQNLLRSFAEIQFMANLLSEISDQMDILAIQAAIQATKAGVQGSGFRVVADALKSLSEKSGEGSRRVASLVETALSDITTVEAAMTDITLKTDEGARLSDISLESTLLVRERLLHLKEKIQQITQSSTTQSDTAERLSSRTSSHISSMEEQSEQAQQAAESMLELVENARLLHETTNKFKV